MLRVSFDHRNTCKRFAGIRRVRSDNRKACRRFFQRFKECILTSAKGVGSLLSFGKSVLTTTKRVGGL